MFPEKWLVLTVRVPTAGHGEEFTEVLLALGGAAVEERADRLSTYIPPPDDVDAFVQDACERFEALAPGREIELEWRWQANEDWAERWRQGLAPRRVGRRLIIAPTWSEPEPEPNDRVIWIDPQMAFGTGEHATTRGVLRLLEETIRPGDRVLDVGTGSGILAITAAILGAEEVVAVESDPDAVLNARENLERNGVAERVELIQGLVDDEWLVSRGAGRFDLIVANVLSGVLIPLLPAFRRALASSSDRAAAGRLILGGILEWEADRVVDAGQCAGLAPVTVEVEEEWWSGLLEARDGAQGAR